MLRHLVWHLARTIVLTKCSQHMSTNLSVIIVKSLRSARRLDYLCVVGGTNIKLFVFALSLYLYFIFVFLFYLLHSDSESYSELSDSDQYQTLRKRTRKCQHNSTPFLSFPTFNIYNLPLFVPLVPYLVQFLVSNHVFRLKIYQFLYQKLVIYYSNLNLKIK